MRQRLENGFEGEVTSLSALKSALQSLDTSSNTYAILLNGDERFIQTAAQEDGFIVERRDGNYRAHFYAARPGSRRAIERQSFLIPRADLGQDRFTRSEVVDMFSAYLKGAEPSRAIEWVPMAMPDPNATSTKIASRARAAAWILMVAIFVGLLIWSNWSRFER